MLGTRDYERIFRRILEWADEFTAGRVLFTLGGGYSLHATPRVWTLLYLMMHDLPLPDGLPEEWRTRWNEAIGGNAPSRFHDAPIVIEADRDGIARHNRHVAERLLEAAKPYWF
jgi:acetoin utilization protein AcuC